MKYDKHKVMKRLPYVFLGIWILSGIIMSPDVIMSSISEDGECGVHVFDDQNTGMGLFFFWVITSLLVPTCVMFFSYAHMIIVISRLCPAEASGGKLMSNKGYKCRNIQG